MMAVETVQFQPVVTSRQQHGRTHRMRIHPRRTMSISMPMLMSMMFLTEMEMDMDMEMAA